MIVIDCNRNNSRNKDIDNDHDDYNDDNDDDIKTIASQLTITSTINNSYLGRYFMLLLLIRKPRNDLSIISLQVFGRIHIDTKRLQRILILGPQFDYI